MSSYDDLNARYHARVELLAGAGLGFGLAFLWGFAEATFWFIAPDFVIMILCAFAPASWRKTVLAAWLGSLAGGLVSWGLNSLFFDSMGQILRATPFVVERMIREIDLLYQQHAEMAVFYQSFSFMQFKIWTHLAVQHGFNPLLYFSIVMVSRAARFAVVALVASLVGRFFPGFIKKHGVVLTLLYAVGFLVMLLRIES